MIKKIVVTTVLGSTFSNSSDKFPNADFQTLEDWKQFHIAENTWGKPERWVRTDEDISGHIDVRYIETEPGNITAEYLMPAQYIIAEFDVTAEASAVLNQKRRVANESFGREFKRWLTLLNEGSGITPAQVIALRADPRVAMANQLAGDGDIPSLKYHIENTDWTGLFPEQVKQAALVMINSYLGT